MTTAHNPPSWNASGIASDQDHPIDTQVLQVVIAGDQPNKTSALQDWLRLGIDSNSLMQQTTNESTPVYYRHIEIKNRHLHVAYIPEHPEAFSHVLSNATNAEVAILVTDTQNGISTATKQYAYLMSAMGIRQIALLIKEEGIADIPQQLSSLHQQFLHWAKPLGFENILALPMSGLLEQTQLSSSKKPQENGPTIEAWLSQITNKVAYTPIFVLSVQRVDTSDNNHICISGSIASGQINTGDRIRVTSSGQVTPIATMFSSGLETKQASAGDAIMLTLEEPITVKRGDVISLAEYPLEMTDQFECSLVWLDPEQAGLVGRNYEIKLANQTANASITTIKYAVDVLTHGHESCRQLHHKTIAVCNVALTTPLTFDEFRQSNVLGSFILIDKFTQATVAVGMIRHNLRRAQNVHKQALTIGKTERETLNGHPGKVIWFTGLSGSGKSTIANKLEQSLYAQGKHTYILDGDNIRQGLNKDLGFTDADRVENIRRVAEVAKLMMDAGLIVMTAFISPFRQEREMARQLIGEDHFIEVFVNTPLALCEERDPKGLYKKARSGKLPNMTGINSPYEPPMNPNYVANTDSESLDAIVNAIQKLTI